MHRFDGVIKADDFIVAVGVKKSNSVYHVVRVKRTVPIRKGIGNRFHMEVINTDLCTALRRDKATQRLIAMQWYKRKKYK